MVNIVQNITDKDFDSFEDEKDIVDIFDSSLQDEKGVYTRGIQSGLIGVLDLDARVLVGAERSMGTVPMLLSSVINNV